MLPDYQVQKPKKSMSKIALLVVFLAGLFAFGFGAYAYVKIHRPPSSESVPVTFSVPKGASTRDVGERLKEERLVGSSYLFAMYATFNGSSSRIQAGDYQLNRNMSMKEILETLTSGKVTVTAKRVTIVEGRTSDQIAAQLDDAGLVTEEQFKNALLEDYDFIFSDAAKEFNYQGFLFPDTYEFNVRWSAPDMVNRMLQNFASRFTEQMLADMESKNLDIKEVIILASIIEREVGRSPSVSLTQDVRDAMQRERETVASVFYNRLEIDMALQSDATVNFVTGKNDRRALLSDIEIDSPYNTYVVKGLPPGPISNPGIDAIRAAIYPADTDYLYFLNNQEGVAFFGRTLDEHNSNRARYLD